MVTKDTGPNSEFPVVPFVLVTGNTKEGSSFMRRQGDTGETGVSLTEEWDRAFECYIWDLGSKKEESLFPDIKYIKFLMRHQILD